MRYTLFDLQREALQPVTAMLSVAEGWARSPVYPLAKTPIGRAQAAWYESWYRLLKSYPKQSWAFNDVQIGDDSFPVRRTIMQNKPFGRLLRFRRADLPQNAPKVLFIAAMSGHHATLSKETYEQFLPDHDVYVTDWLDARDVAMEDGRFGFEEYIDYLIEFMQTIGPNTHMFGLCQASVPALVAASVMSKRKDAARPRSLSIMAGPVDIRVNPNDLLNRAQNLSIKMLKLAAIYRVPNRFAGAGRKVYPGAMQIMGFMSMNVGLHLGKHWQFFRDVAAGREDAADAHREFYNEYFAIMDTTAEFYLETLERVFIEQHLPDGRMQYHGETVTCEDITDIPLLTMEGENDDMVNAGQTSVALELCTNLPDNDKQAYIQPGVGHYGIFKGTRFREETAPVAKAFIAKHSAPRAVASKRRSSKLESA